MTRLLATLLLVGSLLLIVCSAFHPILPLTGPGDLAMIGSMGSWRLIHLGLLYATGLVIAGIWARWFGAERSERPILGIAFVVLGIGEALNGVNIGFMAGAGTEFARLNSQGSDVQQVYQALHLAAIMSGKLAGFLVSLAAGMVALTTRQTPGEPLWLVWLAWLACGAGLAGNLLAPPGHPLMLASIGMMAFWQTATAVRLLRQPR